MTTLAENIGDVSPQGIAAEIARQITSGTLGPGERLPTVRELASRLGVSPATVSHAWQALSSAGMIVSRGRSGSFVRSASDAAWLPRRMQELGGHIGTAALDLSHGTPDPEMLPSLRDAIAHVPLHAQTSAYQEVPVLPALERVLRESWPYEVSAVTVVDGALDAISRTLEQTVRFGDRIAVESPGFPPLFDLLDQFGVERVALEMDAEGVTVPSLRAALNAGVSVIVLQPRAQNPTGASLSAERAEALARELARHPRSNGVVIIEDDHSGLIAAAPEVSLGSWVPDQVVHVRSFSKSHGPDLRIAALGGPQSIIDRVVARRILGPGWTSRMLQAILLHLLTDPTSVAHVARARTVYAARQSSLRSALADIGIATPVADGINAWLPVLDERDAVVRLAAAGIRVAAGTPFWAGPVVGSGAERSAGAGQAPSIRVTVGMMAGDPASVAAALADVVARP